MSQRGIVGPLVLDRLEAASVDHVVEQCLADKNVALLAGTPFAALPRFAAKLRAALRRRRSSSSSLRLWNITRDEADAACRYLMLFSHKDASDVLSDKGMDHVHNVALELAAVLNMPKKGPRELSDDDVADRVDTWNTAGTVVADERWVRRIKKRPAATAAFWQDAGSYARAPIPPSIRPFLWPRFLRPFGFYLTPEIYR